MHKKFFNWKLAAGISLLIMSILVYCCHYIVFRDPHHIFIYLVGDIGFMFLEIFLAVLIIEHILDKREKRSLITKLNMIIGVFFSEIGNEFLRKYSVKVKNLGSIGYDGIKNDWKKRDYLKLKNKLSSLDFDMHIVKEDLKGGCEFLNNKKDLLLSLLENPNLIEYDRFTDMLLSLFHLLEELNFRDDLDNIDQDDLDHLIIDVNRALKAIMLERVYYVEHLSKSYPFLFSLAIRKGIGGRW